MTQSSVGIEEENVSVPAVSSSDSILLTENEIRSEEVRDRIGQIKTTIDTSYAELAQLLYEVSEKGYFVSWGHEKFESYCEDELGIGYRKARYLVIIAGAVSRSGIPWDRVVSIGWTKMRTIARLLTSANAEEWLDRAENNTQDQLLEMTKGVSPGEGIDIDVAPKIHTVQLRMNEDQASIIIDATGYAKRVIDSDSMVDALEHICYEWFQQTSEGPSKTDLSAVLSWIEKTYAVELEAKGPQDLNTILAEDNDASLTEEKTDVAEEP